jgi:hypothetical protein
MVESYIRTKDHQVLVGRERWIQVAPNLVLVLHRGHLTRVLSYA